MGDFVQPRECARRGPELGFGIRAAAQGLVTSLLIRTSGFWPLIVTPESLQHEASSH